MDTAVKLVLIFLFIFILFNSSKAGKHANEEGLADNTALQGEPQYKYVLQDR